MNDNVIVASFSDARHETRTRRVYQYDYGMVLTVDGIDLPTAFEAHFSNADDSGTSVTQIGSDGAVTIPDEYLLTGLPVYCWIYLHSGEDDGETVYKITIPVKKRAQPTNETPTPVQQDAITQAIAALNSAVTQTEEKARSAAGSADDAAGYAEAAKASMESAQEAEENAQQAAMNASGYAEDAGEYASRASQSEVAASQAVQGALASAQAAEESATRAGDAERGAEAAQALAEEAQGQAETAKEDAEAAKASAEDAKGKAIRAQTAAEEAKRDAENAKDDAVDAKTDAVNAKTDAVNAKGEAETAAGHAADAKTAAEEASGKAKDAAEECEVLTDAVAKEETAQSILAEMQEISAALEDMNVIKYYPELPETGTNGFVYITPDGIYYYDGTTDEFISCAGGSGSLNGFSFELDEDRKIIVSYFNPEDETDTDSATVPSADTVGEIITEMQGITSALTKIAEGGE